MSNNEIDATKLGGSTGEKGQVEEGEEVKKEGAGPWTHYVREDLMKERDGRIWGNWSDSGAAACKTSHTNQYIIRGLVTDESDAGKCENGTKIKKFVHN